MADPPDDQLREGWTELPVESAQESYELFGGGLSAIRRFRGPWSDRFNFLALFMPSMIEDGTTSYSYYNTTYPDVPVLVAYKADVIGKQVPGADGASGQISYTAAIIEVSYKADETTFFLTSGRNGQPKPDPEVNPQLRETYEFDSSVEVVKIPGKDVLKWDAGLARHVAQHGKGDFHYRLPLTNLKITYHQASALSAFQALDLKGKINRYQVYIPNGPIGINNFDPFTLRYDGFSGIEEISLRDIISKGIDIKLKITHNFAHNPLQWNRRVTRITQAQDADAEPAYTFENISTYRSVDAFNFLNLGSYTV